jgi:uroporphyrinogen-III synthase
MGAEPTGIGSDAAASGVRASGAPAAGALAGRRIIITRSVADNGPLAEELERLGAQVHQLPLVEVLPAPDGGHALAAAAQHLGDYEWVVLTSANAVEALASAMADTPWSDGVTVAPVGPTTAAAALAAGMTVGDAPPIATAAALVDAFPHARPEGSTVLAPLAELAGPTVVEGLTAKGYRVDRVTAYRTAAPNAPVPDRTELATADAVTFFSPSAVDRYLVLVGTQETASGAPVPPLAFCIGSSTAERARAGGFVEVVMPDVHSQGEVTRAIAARLGPR